MDDLPPVGHLSPAWVDFFIVLGTILLVTLAAFIWAIAFRKSGKRRRKYRHHHGHRHVNPTLAQSGGLPPVQRRKKNGRANADDVMQHSRAITKKSASNLALAFILLPREKRNAMSALYAFCREVDDVADDESVPAEKRRAQLSEWRADVKRACENQSPQFPVNRELQPVIQQFGLRFELFDDLLKGCEMDLARNRYEDFEALEKYCYHVASVVGLLSIEIFGYKNPETRDYAIYLGKALQLTNILRDVKTDAERGRIYLPLDQLRKFRVTSDEILQSRYSDRFCALAEAIAARAKNFYQLAGKTLPDEDCRSMVAAELMGTIYWKLLDQLERKKFRVFDQQIRLSKRYKLLLIFLAWTRYGVRSASSNYAC